jgi:kynurenine formamidase
MPLTLRVLSALVFVPFSAFAANAIDESKLIDLTHPFDDDTINWPTAKPFHWQKDAWGPTPAGYWYASASFSSSEHLGTHIDSPIHFAEGGLTTDQIPIQKLVGPAAVIDISEGCAKSADYLLSPADIAAWERSHGRIPRATIVLIRTGWSRFWPDRKRYMGTDAPGDVTHLHFPGIAPEAARVLADRGVDAVGIDTASIDYGQSKDFQTHQLLLRAGIFGLENIDGLDRLPSTGATLIALPMKIRNGTGGPTRIIALLP